MVRDLRSYEWEEFYSTGKHNLAEAFYGPAISQSVLIERAVGFFRSTAYLLMYEEMCSFIKDGGKIKLICSPKMHKEDINTFEHVFSSTQAPASHDGVAELLLEIDTLQCTKEGRLHLKLIGGMLKLGILELKIALTSDGNGIFHEKIGILHDPNDEIISFSGSTNETLCGWGLYGNVESFDVFQGWKKGDESRVKNHRIAFDEAWQGNRPGVRTIELDIAIKNRLLEETSEDLGEMLRSLELYQSLLNRKSQQQLKPNLHKELITNSWPSGRIAEDHQLQALKQWYKNNCKGIFKHATGSGKTFTGIHAIRDHIGNGDIVLVVVPSKLLFIAWRDEIRQEVPYATLALAGNGHTEWKQPFFLESITTPSGTESRRIILATMQTASSPQFYNRLKNINKILLLADEVHQLGSNEFSKLMLKNFGMRLGLSATPERFGDPVGTSSLIGYFGGIIGEEFTLSDAMNAGRLVPYNYYPELVYFTDMERDSWKDFTLKIRQQVASSCRDKEGNFSPSIRLKNLLINRARIAKKAHNKISSTVQIIIENYQLGQYWLIYCEDKNQMKDVIDALNAKGIDSLIYHSAMEGDPERTLNYFINHGGIMVSIRCLDEGVDIPKITHAIILASSQNPRQFIQRRGRVLRVTSGKTLAHIWDTIVIPSLDDSDDEFQDSLTKAEFARALEFSNHAMNQEDASNLRLMALDLGIDAKKIYGAEEDKINEEDE